MANSSPNLDDSKEIIFIALSNSFVSYNQLLEDKGIDPQEREMIEYIVKRITDLLGQYEEEISGTKTIERPSW